jgi:hypothetical protein
VNDPVNPYASPSELNREGPRPFPPALANPFADAFATGTRLFLWNFREVLLVVVVIYLPINLYLSYYELFLIAEDDIRSSLRMARSLDTFFGVLAMGGVIAIGDAALNQRPTSFASALGVSFRHWGTFVLAGVASSFAVLLGLLCLILPGIFLLVCLTYLLPSIVVENAGVQESFRRSLDVGKRNFWLSLGIVICGLLVVFGIGLGSGLIVGVLSMLELSNGVLWGTNALLSFPIDLANAWFHLVILAAYRRLREPSPRKNLPASDSYVPQSLPELSQNDDRPGPSL